MKNLVNILGILMKYVGESASYAAEHDQLFLEGPDPKEMSPAHAELLESWGCHWDDEIETWYLFT